MTGKVDRQKRASGGLYFMRGAIVVIQLSESIIIRKCEKSMFIL